jgi:DNA-binding SARP family transcriptional activator
VARTCTLVPLLVELGAHDEAARRLEEVLAAWEQRWPGDRGRLYRARLRVAHAWVLHSRGRVDRAVHLLAGAWKDAGDCMPHVLRPDWTRLRTLVQDALTQGSVDVDTAIEALRGVSADGAALVELMRDHPAEGVRERAESFLLASGHPAALSHAMQHPARAGTALAPIQSQAIARLVVAAPPLRFTMLGRFRLCRGTWEIERAQWRRPIASRLVRVLLAHRESPLPEDLLFEYLWPDRPWELARRSLQVAVSQARAVLDLPGAVASAIEGSERAYQLILRDEDSVDTDEFEALAAAALAETGPARRDVLERAVRRWGGEPLAEDRYTSWAQAWRARLLDLYEHVLLELALAREHEGDHFAAIDAANVLLAHDATNEPAHALIMQANARAGRKGHALRQYLACRRAFVDALGLEPSAQTQALQARILAGEAV